MKKPLKTSEAKSPDLSLVPQIGQSKQLVIKFNTEKHSIDAAVVGNALLDLKHTIERIAAERPEIEETRFEIQTVSSGCVEIGTIIEVLQSIANPETLSYIGTVIKDLFSLFRFLRGKKAKKIENKNETEKVVTREDGATQVFNNCVINVFSQSNVSPLGDLTNLSSTGTKSVSVRFGKTEELVRIEKDEFASFGKKPTDEEIGTEKFEETEEVLTISKIPISKPERAQWGFIQGGDSISAKIVDDKFTNQINTHQISFSQGDRIRALVRKRLVFDEVKKCFVTKSRQILSVLEFTRYAHLQQDQLL